MGFGWGKGVGREGPCMEVRMGLLDDQIASQTLTQFLYSSEFYRTPLLTMAI